MTSEKNPAPRYRNGIRLLPVRPDGGPVTPEMVKRLMEELDELDMLRAMNPNADLPR
jgi:hypothetical protein